MAQLREEDEEQPTSGSDARELERDWTLEE
jgi:hypothetical protein